MNQIDLGGRIAIVTGGAQGLGRAVAERLAASGARVAIWDRDDVAAKATADAIGGVQAIALDVTDPDAVHQAVRQTEQSLGPIDIFVANAGISGSTVPVQDQTLEDWRRTIEVNLNSVFYCCQAVIPGMIARDYGRIVNVASVAGKEGNPNSSAYSAAKAGVIALTKSLGKETAGKNIAVNCVTPGAARTRIFDTVPQSHVDYMLSKIPRGRFLRVEEAAAMIAWLASEENSFTTSATFDLSGGRATY